MNKTNFSVLLALVFAILSGCKMELVTDLYSSDLRATASGEEGLTTPATLALPISTEDKCEEETAKIVAIMQGIVDPFEPKGCTRKNMDSFMLADLKIPILDAMADWEQTDALFGIVSQRDAEKADHINVFIMMDLERYRILAERVRDEFYQSLELDQSSVSIVLNNDEREDASIRVEHAFVQGAPVLSHTDTIGRREQIEINFSNVSVAFLGRHGSSPAFVLVDEGE